jgi:hypothetical protein
VPTTKIVTAEACACQGKYLIPLPRKRWLD